METPPPLRKSLRSGVVAKEGKPSLLGWLPLKPLNPRTYSNWLAAQGRWQGEIFVEHAFLFPTRKGTGVCRRGVSARPRLSLETALEQWPR